jgi:hypothetical protein
MIKVGQWIEILENDLQKADVLSGERYQVIETSEQNNPKYFSVLSKNKKIKWWFSSNELNVGFKLINPPHLNKIPLT